MNEIKEILRNSYQKKSLQFIISLSFTFVSIVVVFLISIGYASQFKRTTEDLVSNNNSNLIDQVSLNLDDYLHSLMNISNTAYYKVIKELDSTNNEEELTKQIGYLYQMNQNNLLNIAIFDNKGELVTSQPPETLKKTAIIKNQEWYLKAVNKIENIHFSTPHVDPNFHHENNSYHWVISLSRSIELTNKGESSQGVLLLNMNFSGIEKICKDVKLGNDGYIYLIKNDGDIIYHPKQQLLNSEIFKENNYEAATYKEGSHFEKFKGVSRLITVKTMGYSGWKIVGVLPVKDYENGFKTNKKFIWLIGIIASLFLGLINLILALKVTNPIKNLERSVLRIEKDIEDIDIPEKGTIEIRHLGNTLESMAKTMKKLIDVSVLEQKSKRKTEMLALQAQINPHFLYNTLDSTVWMIENERYEGAVTMLTSLAQFFRVALSKGDTIILLEDELTHAKSYLAIQKIRYKNKFNYTIECEEDIKKNITIKLIIQPLLENAIYHAIDYMDEDGEISITAYKSGEEVFIDIEDNGPGMSSEQVDNLLIGAVQSSKKNGSGIGFNNVHQRIKLYFGKDYGLEVYSEPDEGTKIRIRIPKQIIMDESEVVKLNETV